MGTRNHFITHFPTTFTNKPMSRKHKSMDSILVQDNSQEDVIERVCNIINDVSEARGCFETLDYWQEICDEMQRLVWHSDKSLSEVRHFLKYVLSVNAKSTCTDALFDLSTLDNLMELYRQIAAANTAGQQRWYSF